MLDELGKMPEAMAGASMHIWHVAVTLTRQTPQTQKSTMLSVPAWQSLLQFAVYREAPGLRGGHMRWW